jgi:Gluconate 2-dehydrogenase subunit 3
MSAAPGRPGAPGRRSAGLESRFPGFDVLSQARHWDQVTADVVLGRTGPPPVLKFFTAAEEACAAALLDQLTGQNEEPRVPVLQMIDARLAAGETDGWRYADMPEDSQAWRDTLSYLDADAALRCGTAFADATPVEQMALLQAVQDLGSGEWHGLPAAHVWSLWTRYACTAFYSHPSAWSEIGFPGPAYPRGYKNTGVGKREPFEVQDAQPSDDPVQEGA